MDKINEPVTITGRTAVLVSKYTGFELSDPGATKVHHFTFQSDEVIDETGALNSIWAKDGWRHVGWAEIKIEVMPVKGMLASAVAALQAEKTAVLAEAQKRATEIEGEIQKLLAIEFDASTVEAE